MALLQVSGLFRFLVSGKSVPSLTFFSSGKWDIWEPWYLFHNLKRYCFQELRDFFSLGKKGTRIYLGETLLLQFSADENLIWRVLWAGSFKLYKFRFTNRATSPDRLHRSSVLACFTVIRAYLANNTMYHRRDILLRKGNAYRGQIWLCVVQCTPSPLWGMACTRSAVRECLNDRRK